MPRCWRLRAFAVMRVLRLEIFLETPAELWTARTEFLCEIVSRGGVISLMDLSVLMEGEVARRAARERLEISRIC